MKQLLSSILIGIGLLGYTAANAQVVVGHSHCGTCYAPAVVAAPVAYPVVVSAPPVVVMPVVQQVVAVPVMPMVAVQPLVPVVSTGCVQWSCR